MRQFVVVGHEVPATADFSLEDLPGAGRVDLLARSVTAGLLLSHGIRADTRVHLVVEDSYTITFDGGDLQGLNPDERSTAARIRTALDQREEAIGHEPAPISPGVSITRRGFEPTVDALADEGTVVQLHEDGDPVVEGSVPDDPVFVLSDHRDFTEEERAYLAGVTDRRVRLGPERLHTDQAVVVAHNYLDTDGFGTY